MSKWGNQKVWTPAEILLRMQVFHYRHGFWPETKDFNADAEMPSSATVRRMFGTLAEARRQAGARHGGHEGRGGIGRGGRIGQKWDAGRDRSAALRNLEKARLMRA